MRGFNVYFKFLAFYLSAVIIIQGCASAYQGSYTLPEALASERKARITTHDNERIEYKKIDTLKGQWVGERVTGDRVVLEPIIPNRISKIELGPSAQTQAKDGQTVLAIIAGIVLMVVLVVSAASNINVFGG